MKLFKKNSPVRQQSVPAKQRNVFSYYANRSSDQTNTGRAGQADITPGRGWWRLLPSIIAALAVVMSLGYILKLNTNPKISVTQNHLALHSPQVYQEAAQALLRRSWFNRNKLTIDTGGVERSLKQQFPELDEVAITLPLVGHRPVIELATVQPVLVLSTANGLFVIAGNGKAITAGVNTADKTLSDLPVVIDKSDLVVKLGQAALPELQVDFLRLLIAQLRVQQLAVQSLTLPAIPNEVDVQLKNTAYLLKFNTNLDVRQQVGSYLAVKQRLSSQHTKPSQYIDLRVEEKVFYK